MLSHPKPTFNASKTTMELTTLSLLQFGKTCRPPLFQKPESWHWNTIISWKHWISCVGTRQKQNSGGDDYRCCGAYLFGGSGRHSRFASMVRFFFLVCFFLFCLLGCHFLLVTILFPSLVRFFCIIQILWGCSRYLFVLGDGSKTQNRTQNHDREIDSLSVYCIYLVFAFRYIAIVSNLVKRQNDFPCSIDRYIRCASGIPSPAVYPRKSMHRAPQEGCMKLSDRYCTFWGRSELNFSESHTHQRTKNTFYC